MNTLAMLLLLAGQPNILLIQADDLGYGDLSAYGQSRFETPELDELAREGIRFTQYYAGSAVCAPSRATLMTGLHTGHTWIRGNGGHGNELAMRDATVTVAEVLKAAGYRTAVIGKWGLGPPGSTGDPNRQGFDYAFGYLDHHHAHRQYPERLWRNGKPIDVDSYANDLFTSETAAFIKRDDPRPFFVYLNYTVPHANLRVPEDSMAPFTFDERPYRNWTADFHLTWLLGGSDYLSQPTPFAAYAGMITRMDRDIGRLADMVDDNTLVLFISDNGPHQSAGADPVFFKSSGRLRGIKRDVYEGGIRVPMIARWPRKIPAGTVSDHVWAHWDILPTLADIAGARTPNGLDGMSMALALRGEPQETHEFLYWELDARIQGHTFEQAVRMGRWKAVLGVNKPIELYDLETDPAEKNDVSAANPTVIASITAYLATARTELLAAD